MAKKRKQVSKKLRFEVFKRDSFKCQYCGAAAPETVLQIDHIKPVSKGGSNDITNLIAACVECNLGKSNRELGDSTTIEKSRAQLEELQARHEQLEMMMRWREGLQLLDEKTVDRVAEYWERFLDDRVVNEHGKRGLKRLVNQFSVDELIKAMDVAADKYLEWDDEGHVTTESAEVAFQKLGGICRVTREKKEHPEISQIYYIRGILRNRCQYFDDGLALRMLREAYDRGANLESLKMMALSVNNWSQFRAAVEDFLMDEQGGERKEGG